MQHRTAEPTATAGTPSRRPTRLVRWLAARPVLAALLALAVVTGAVTGAVASPVLASADLQGPDHGPASLRAAAFPTPNFAHLDHIFVIMMENSSYSGLMSPSNPDTSYIRSLAANAGLATQYFGVTHTSLPNYIAATSGRAWGSHSDDTAQAPSFNHENLVDELQAAHISWGAYMQSLPKPGDTVDKTANGLYVRKHDPFLMYPDVYTNPARADKVVPLHALRTQLATGDVPQFVWISPNICNDMHGGAPTCPYASSTNPAYQAALYRNGDTFLKTWVRRITSSQAWRQGNSAIFVTWDEGAYNVSSPYQPLDLRGAGDSPVLPSKPVDPATGSGGDLAGGTVYGGGHVPMIVVTSHLTHRTDTTPTNHYSLLRTIEENFGLPLLGDAGDSVQVHSLAPLLAPVHGAGRR